MDRFAQIAKEGVSVQERGLIIPEPEKKDAIFLQNISDARYQFTPLKKMDSEEELSEALLAARKEYRPYMQDLAPEMEELRERMPIQRAGWRIQTKADQQDFQGVLDGKGQWEEVQLPHYGAPVGKATTFYRMCFDLTESMASKDAIYLCFKGVDYKAAVYVNYRFVGSHEGFFAPFEFQITNFVREKDNVLLVVVENDAVHSDGGEKITRQRAWDLMTARWAGITVRQGWGCIRRFMWKGVGPYRSRILLFSPWRTWRMQAAGLRSAPPVRSRRRSAWSYPYTDKILTRRCSRRCPTTHPPTWRSAWEIP